MCKTQFQNPSYDSQLTRQKITVKQLIAKKKEERKQKKPLTYSMEHSKQNWAYKHSKTIFDKVND